MTASRARCILILVVVSRRATRRAWYLAKAKQGVVGEIEASETWMGEEIYEQACLCSKHSNKFSLLTHTTHIFRTSTAFSCYIR